MIKLIDVTILMVTTLASSIGLIMTVLWAWNRSIDFDFWFFLSVASLCVALIWVEISNRYIKWE